MNLNLNPTPDEAQTNMDNEIKAFSLVGRGGWPVVVLWLLAVLLGFFNFMLFYETARGFKGVITGTIALAVEGTALYCVLNYSRSKEEHKKALGIWGKRFFAFSLVHATASFIHTSGVEFLNWPIWFYSHLIAFPVMVVLLTIGINKIIMSHWSGKVLEDLAASKIQAIRNRAEALMKQSEMLDSHEIATLRGQIFAQAAELQSKLLPIIRRFIMIREERNKLIKDIPDPLLREQMQTDIKQLFAEKTPKKPRKAPELPELDESQGDPFLLNEAVDIAPLKNGKIEHP